MTKFKYSLYSTIYLIAFAGAIACKSTHTATSGTTAPVVKTGASSVQYWLTDADKDVRFQQQSPLPLQLQNGKGTIVINDSTFQSMEGFGCTLTGGSATLIQQMDAASRNALLQELFGKSDKAIGISYLRVSIAASDMNATVFSYDDMPAGQTDTTLSHFSLGPDLNDVVPVLKAILQINPAIKILASPWSAPVWMKSNGDTRGGSLLPQYYGVYAQYFVKYLQAMQAQGIPVDAVTIQNEPLHPGNNPSMKMLPEEQAAFIKNDLGPAFAKANIKTKIIVYDHNADRPDYPITVMSDPGANQYIDGSAFHLYGGKIEALSTVHNAFPNKNLYFTEQWIGAPGNLKKDLGEHIHLLTIGATRNWARAVLEWNLAADPQQNPHTDRGGCNGCLGAVTLDGNTITRNPAYYIMAHAAKFVVPGSLRVGSNDISGLPNVAFKTPDGKHVLIVLNQDAQTKTFAVAGNGYHFNATLNSGAVATYVW